MGVLGRSLWCNMSTGFREEREDDLRLKEQLFPQTHPKRHIQVLILLARAGWVLHVAFWHEKVSLSRSEEADTGGSRK